MAKQKSPTDEELIKYEKLCSIAFSRMTGARVEVKLNAFDIPAEITKSRIFGAHVGENSEETGTVNIPSKVIIKQYIPGLIRTSEDTESISEEFKREKTILEEDIHTNPNGAEGERVRIYPISYSRDVPECDEDMIIIREYIHGENLKKIAKDQLGEHGEIKWEATVGVPTISDSLYPIALLHVQSPVIASKLQERGLLKSGVPSEASTAQISEARSNAFLKYVQILVNGLGGEVDNGDKDKLRELCLTQDMKLVSKKDLLSIVDGELDVFAHHAMLKRLPDAGGVEVGGFVRDLAVYSDPAFSPLWEKDGLDKMPDRVLLSYLPIRRQFEKNLRYPGVEFNEEELARGLLFASFFGNIRKSAAIVYYNGQDEGYPVEEETSLYLANAFEYLDALIKRTGRKGDDTPKLREMRDALKKHKLKTDRYELKLVDAK